MAEKPVKSCKLSSEHLYRSCRETCMGGAIHRWRELFALSLLNMKNLPKERDLLYNEAKKLIQAHPRGTTGLIQRHLGIGYSLASLILDQLAEENFLTLENGNYKLINKNRNKDIIITLLLFSLLVVIAGFIFYKPLINFSNKTIENITNPSSSSSCERKEPYSIPPEFSRALSIIEQRTADLNFMSDFKNCLNIQYKNLQDEGLNAEGVFLFDDSTSSTNNLVIYVDSSYKNYDDYLTAILLVHEITHANQYYRGTNKSCVDKEVSAFYNEIVLYTKLNKEERESISARIYSKTNEPSEPIKNIGTLLDIGVIASKGCNGNSSCILQNYRNLLNKMVTESPYYQKECGLN